MQRDDGSLIIAQRHNHDLADYHIWQGKSKDCGPHTAATVINFCRGQSIIDPEDLARQMNKPRLGSDLPFVHIRRIPNWATFPWGIADVFKAYGLKPRWRFGATESDLRQSLREDRLLMPIFGEPFQRRGIKWHGWSHIALLAGWEPGKYWFIDSSKETAPTYKSEQDFLRMWRGMGRILVEVR
jgi:hypothetical protein